jgi:hypothetical protein
LEVYVDAIGAFPGVTLWEKFDNTCKQAEAVRDRAVDDATRERDQVTNPVVAAAWTASDRVQRAANARYEAKVTTAQTKYDKECGNAEAELTRALDQRETAHLWER